jgi:hypothetical protein
MASPFFDPSVGIRRLFATAPETPTATPATLQWRQSRREKGIPDNAKKTAAAAFLSVSGLNPQIAVTIP